MRFRRLWNVTLHDQGSTCATLIHRWFDFYRCIFKECLTGTWNYFLGLVLCCGVLSTHSLVRTHSWLNSRRSCWFTKTQLWFLDCYWHGCGSGRIIDSPNSVSTLRGSYGNSWGPVFNRGGIRSVRHFPCKFPYKMALVKCPCPRGLWHFPCKFPHKIALVTCPCAFRLCRLAQNDVPGRGVWHFPWHFHTKWLLWNVHVRLECGGSHKMLAAGVATGIVPINFHTKLLWWHAHVHVDCAGLHKTMSPGGAFGIFHVNFHTKWSLWNVHVHFEGASSHKTMSPEGRLTLSLSISIQNGSYSDMSMCVSTAWARTKRCPREGGLAFSL